MSIHRIDWIIEESAKWDKMNGVSYRFARVTSTRTSKSIFVKDGIAGNIRAIMRRDPEDGTKPISTYGANDIKSIETWESATDWNRIKKFGSGFDGMNATFGVYMHQLTPKMLRALKSSKVPAYVDAERVDVA